MKENLEYNQQKEQTNSKKRDKKWINPQNHVKSGDFPGNKRKNHDKRKIRKKKDDRPNRSVRTVSSAEDVRPGDRIVVTIKRIGINGEGVGYYKRKAVFIPGAITGEVVKAQVTKVQSGYLEAKPSEIEKSSPDRQIPPCPVFDQCGGCQLQHMTYSSQLAAKEEIVRESFRRYLGDNAGILIRPIRGMDHPWDYRNKAQLQTEVRDSRVITGLYTPGTHHLVDISGCLVQDPVINHVMQVMKEIVSELDIPVYNEKKRSGVLRTIVARVARSTGKVQLTLITATPFLPKHEKLVSAVHQRMPEVAEITHNVNPDDTPLVFGERTVHLSGEDRLEETLGPLRFELSPRAFFQLNPSQTVHLYDYVKEAAALTGDELVVDAYCGTGTIGLWLAPLACEVRGIEIIDDAVQDARRNAERSGLGNARFYTGRAEKLLPQWVREGVRPDVVVVDPPRTGCDAALLRAILAAKPPRLVYVSCNPSTLAKDCRTLLGGGYSAEWVQPVDMFPQTAHVECVIRIQRIDT